jgi:enterochelin esterase-like enzyme
MCRFNPARWARWFTLTLLVLVFAGIGLGATAAYLHDYAQHRGFAPVAPLSKTKPGRLLTLTFYSKALHRQADYLVYLPSGYSASRHYPVLYALHGAPGYPKAYIDVDTANVRLDNLIKEGRVQPMIMVFPDGRINGNTFSDSEWANTPAGQFESYVIDVVHDVDRRLPTIPDRGARLIMGDSAGAYGAINVALHHLSVFGSVQVWSGYFIQTRSAVFAGATSAALARNSPLDYVGSLRSQLASNPLNAFLYTGQSDPYRQQTPAMAAALKAEGATVAFAIYPGGHDWQLWNAHFDQMLVLASKQLRMPAVHAQRVMARQVAPGRGRRDSRASPTSRWHRLAPSALLLGLVLALFSAIAINFGFLLQHRALLRRQDEGTGVRALLRSMRGNRLWFAGQAIGWVGFGMQVVAVAVSFLSLVQAFSAAGLALSVPLAAWMFGHRVTRRQVLAVLSIAASLSVLPFGLHAAVDHLRTGQLEISLAGTFVLACGLALTGTATLRAMSAGLFYGAADAALKGAFAGAGGHLAPFAGWAGLAVLGTGGGFIAFQSALRGGSAVTAISVMNAVSALVALGCGVADFGESLGASSTAVLAHAVAIAVLIACIPVLVSGQSDIADCGTELRGTAGERARNRRAGREQHRLQPHAKTGGA